MSLAAFAVRTCLVQAIRGQTLAGDSVEDSPVDPVAMAAATKAPVISVSSDHELFRPQARSFFESVDDPDVPNGNVIDLTLFVFLPQNPALPVPGLPDQPLDARESGAAFAFDLIWRQLVRVLALDDVPTPGGAWADLWRMAVNSIVSVETSAYVGQSKDDVYLPAREIVMRLDVLNDPGFGAMQSEFWPRFLDAVDGCADLDGLAPVLRAAITGDDLPPWRAVAAQLGIRPSEAVGISLGPLGGGPTDPLVPLSGVAVDGADPGAPDGALVVASAP